ncbi:M48 family metallopeptidase [Chthonobacter rhizosphaerae]|uniref:M48 family metallopeptidase n=1 Tax=Chthonobacter rhizosphaerae TaxID=2735553 RepID=UPI0015EF1A71|nr:SprT family zinc-dependent metalloprotease [Chthonobacter rhizosphaerae]
MPNRWIPFLFSPPKTPSPKPAPSAFEVVVAGRPIPVALRRNVRAKRYTLRLDPRRDGAVVTVPKRGTVSEAKAFVGRHLDWLAERIGDGTPASSLVPGGLVPVRGVPHLIHPTGAVRGVVEARVENGRPVLLVPGDRAHLARRILDHLKAEARADLTRAVARHAATLDVTPTAIRLKDTASRWGSASSRGTLSFSWRLVMAPPFVLDYLAAHEVAHLREMNHSDAFWRICVALAPRTDEAKAWLKANGRALHRVG